MKNPIKCFIQVNYAWNRNHEFRMICNSSNDLLFDDCVLNVRKIIQFQFIYCK